MKAVAGSSVIGVPAPRWGEVGLALVQLRDGARLDADRVLARCRERLAGYKVPRRVEFVERLPLSPQRSQWPFWAIPVPPTPSPPR